MINIEEYFKNFYMTTKKPTLETMQYFMNIYKNPQKDMKFIHIAGTNGKGSCVEMLSKILVENGYKVGKFISPHLKKYNERISINGKNIEDNELRELLNDLKPKIENYNEKNQNRVTFFELMTILAILYFRKKEVDFVIFEVGLGGLFDSTNVIPPPVVSIITSIGWDHMNILGDSLEKIALQKAGIIKKNSETIFFEQELQVNQVIIEKCREEKNRLHLIVEEDLVRKNDNGQFQSFDYQEFKDIKINLKGCKQINNACLCLETVRILREKGYSIKNEKLKKALQNIIHPGRFEFLKQKPIIIYDGAHNLSAIDNLNENIEKYYKNNKKIFVVSILKTKDYKAILKSLSKNENSFFIFTSGNDKEKFVSAEDLYFEAQQLGFYENIEIQELKNAIESIKITVKNEIVFIVGSFYIYADVDKMLNSIEF